MCGWPIIFHLVICFFYLPYHNQHFCLLIAFVKWNFVFTLKNSGPAKTDQSDCLLRPWSDPCNWRMHIAVYLHSFDTSSWEQDSKTSDPLPPTQYASPAYGYTLHMHRNTVELKISKRVLRISKKNIDYELLVLILKCFQ